MSQTNNAMLLWAHVKYSDHTLRMDDSWHMTILKHANNYFGITNVSGRLRRCRIRLSVVCTTLSAEYRSWLENVFAIDLSGSKTKGLFNSSIENEIPAFSAESSEEDELSHETFRDEDLFDDYKSNDIDSNILYRFLHSTLTPD